MRLYSVIVAAFLTSITGCTVFKDGMPMIHTPDKESQQSLDEAWARLLAEETDEQLDRLAILDFMLLSQGFQYGADRVDYRAEKAVGARRVVMSVSYLRSEPDRQRFVVEIFDAAGQLTRREQYDTETLRHAAKVHGESMDVNGVDVLDQSEEVEALRKEKKRRLERLESILGPIHPDRDDQEAEST